MLARPILEQRQSGTLQVACALPKIRQLVRLTGLDRQIPLARTLDEALEFRAEGSTEFVLGSAAKHPHPLVCGYYSVHTSEHALALGEAGIRKVASALRARQGMVALPGGTT